ncbi:histidinol phosphate phosphatase domain-containing protein [Brevibacillus migulae]|uniref:histidinol phosphate phosphatase domain-containing protein n=1 Tax=Brevibacillus migulae TaxID=1644114 RepID=UPI00106DEAA8|nr:histidinol phosphate phosphatase domain-containing protein [Brevibacillus migulae]
MIDMHVHLEEGPYSLRWLQRTGEALCFFMEQQQEQKHTEAWLQQTFALLQQRMMKGAYSREWLDLYRKRAKQLGIVQVGIVDHLYRFQEYKDYYLTHMHVADDPLGRLQEQWLEQVCTASLEEFVTFLQGEQAHWAADGVELKIGIELDYFPGGEAELAGVIRHYPWDHTIGSVHFLDGWGFDNPETQDRYQRADLLALYERYFAVMEQGIKSRLFDIAAHPDNLKVFGYRPAEALLLPMYERIARSLVENGVATEINTGLLYRYPVKEMCPSMTFLKVLARFQVPVTTSSDAHFPDHLGQHVADAIAVLEQAGYERVLSFSQRRRIDMELKR